MRDRHRFAGSRARSYFVAGFVATATVGCSSDDKPNGREQGASSAGGSRVQPSGGGTANHTGTGGTGSASMPADAGSPPSGGGAHEAGASSTGVSGKEAGAGEPDTSSAGAPGSGREGGADGVREDASKEGGGSTVEDAGDAGPEGCARSRLMPDGKYHLRLRNYINRCTTSADPPACDPQPTEEKDGDATLTVSISFDVPGDYTTWEVTGKLEAPSLDLNGWDLHSETYSTGYLLAAPGQSSEDFRGRDLRTLKDRTVTVEFLTPEHSPLPPDRPDWVDVTIDMATGRVTRFDRGYMWQGLSSYISVFETGDGALECGDQ
jgi:hypothetical protein